MHSVYYFRIILLYYFANFILISRVYLSIGVEGVRNFSIALVSLRYIERVNSMSDCHVRPTASCRQDGTTSDSQSSVTGN